MGVIGVYDSGVGGLSTLSALKSVLTGQDFCYLADTANMPFGVKSREEIYASVSRGVKTLRALSDAVVIACNTASTVVTPENAYLLRPVVDGLEPKATLFLSTPATTSALRVKEKGFVTACTKDLATAVEIACSLSYKIGDRLHIEYLDGTVKSMLKSVGGRLLQVNTVVIGCSHYVYLKPIIKSYLPKARIIDGNHALKLEVFEGVKGSKGQGKTDFKFTLGNEESKYAWVLNQLDQNRDYFGI